MTDPYFTAPIARHIWDVKYRHREGGAVHETSVSDSWRRIARAVAAVEGHAREGWETRFYAALEGFKFLPGGRIQAGAGTAHKVTLFNCFVMGTIDDSMDGIFDALKEGALTMQQGGGVGYDFSTLRPRGTRAYSVGSVASGPVSFMRIWDSMCATILSTGARRGAMMGTLRCDHPDIEEFIAVKQDKTQLRHFNVSILVSDAFMAAVRDDRDWPLLFPADEHGAVAETAMSPWPGRSGAVACEVHRRVRARALWEKIMRATYDYAEPGVLFIDRINQLNNLYYRERISATNPCVTADTWVHTSDGPRQVGELVGHPFTAVVNGRAYRSGDQGFFSTGKRHVLKLRTREGYSLRLTEDHLVQRVDRLSRWSLTASWVKAGHLRSGDYLVLNDNRGRTAWDGPLGQDEGYLIGLLVGDGTFSEDVAELRAWPGASAVGDDDMPRPGISAVMKRVEEIVFRMPHRSDFSGWRQGHGGYRFLKLAHLTRLAQTLGINPDNKRITENVERCSSDFYKGFLRGLFDADGSVQGNQRKGVSIRLAQSDSELLEAVQRMLLRMGINSVIYRERRPQGDRLLPDGHGGAKHYFCRANHELVIAGEGMARFAALIGFADSEKQIRLVSLLNSYKRKLNRERFVAQVQSVEAQGVSPVYDVQIPGINAFDANGLYVHNCGEVPLPPYGACNLGSINLTRFVRDPFTARARLDLRGIGETARAAVRFLDNVIDASQFPLPAQAEQARGSRRIGLGLTGLADALMMLDIRYGGEESMELARTVMRTLCHGAYRTSIAIAGEKGPFPFFDKAKYLDGAFVRGLPADIRDGIARYGIRNSHLTAIAPTGTISLLANNISSGLEPVFDSEFSRRVLEFDGSYSEYRVVDYAVALWRSGSGVGTALPPAFIDAHHLEPVVHLDMQAAIQPYVDQAISKTINVPAAYDFAAFRDLYQAAFDKGLKGCTTFRPNPVTGEILRGITQEEMASHCCNMEREAD
jgi:ribonucleoside-diphosphate reductase alpha chain